MRTHPLVIKALAGKPLRDFNGMCGEIADDILHVAEAAGHTTALLHVHCRLLFTPLVPSYDRRRHWKYHQVAVIDGLALDPWSKYEPAAPAQYVAKVFPDQLCTAEVTDSGITFVSVWAGAATP